MSFKDKLKELRKSRHLTQEQLAGALGITRSRLGMYESGDRQPKPDIQEKIADYFNVDLDYLFGRKTGHIYRLSDNDNVFVMEKAGYPVAGCVKSGFPDYSEEMLTSFFSRDLDPDCDFVLKMPDDAMLNAGIRKDFYVFIKKMPAVENGKIACVVVGREALVRRIFFYKDRKLLVLRAENPDFPDLEFKDQAVQDVFIVGRAVLFQGEL
ncbi:MAG: helix-turn-helix domain-containing protein [Lachnospiraceae bacterium]|nr:helix-turn-helix domain-containing protein [Lachnospiraceae bacterium]